MEAKDTALIEDELRLICVKAYRDATGEVVSPFAIDMTCPKAIAEAQAGISFRAGIKEVVDFTVPLLDRINELASDIRGDWTDPRAECREIWNIIVEWQTKLKNWGL